jgi:hypothetical protein
MKMEAGQSLIVPLQVHAMCVGEDESKQKGSCFSPPTAKYDLALSRLVKGDYIKRPFATDTRTSKDLKGVHLHWFLPDALTHVSDATDIEGIVPHVFPVVPNRWLVTRVHIKNVTETDPLCESRSWVVESDFLSTDEQYQNSTTIPQLNDDITYRFIGRAIPLEEWQGEDTEAERFQRLTAIGHGDPSFSLYYPNCRNVFGFHDSLEDLSDYSPQESQLNYIVIGWYTDEQEDPLTVAHNAKKIKDLLDYFNWFVEKDSDVKHINQTICCGMVRDIQWNPKDEYLSSVIEKNKSVSVGIGNRVSDGLSALLAGINGGKNKEKKGKLLDAFQAGHLDLLDKVDAMADLTKTLHKNTFTSESGGVAWSIKAKDQGKKVALKALSRDVAFKLDELNSKQTQFNRKFFESESKKQQTFLDWYKYMFFKYDPDTKDDLENREINVKRFKKFLEPETNSEEKINKLYLEIEELLQALNERIGNDYLLKKDRVAPRFFRPNDPVILMAGEALRPTLHHTPNQMTPCLLDDQLPSSFTLKNGLILSVNSKNLLEQGDLPKCTNKLLNELFFLDPAQIPVIAARVSAKECFTDLIALNSWTRPWNPIFMHWSIEYQPLKKIGKRSKPKRFPDDLITSRFTLSEHTIDLTEQESSKQKYESYEGITILTPHAVQSFEELAQSYENESSEKGEISKALEALKETPVLSQSLSGFHDALIMRTGEMLFPVNDLHADESEKEFHQTIRAYVGELDQYAPTPNKYFNPVRAGWMKIGKIRIVDTFGQYRDIEPGKVCVSQSLTSKKGSKPKIFLPPRLVQPSRLLLSWMSAEKESMETNDHPASTPVCGWVLPNFLGQSLLIYNSDGTPIGEIRSWENGDTIFQSSPGRSPAFSILFADKANFDKEMGVAIPENVSLRNYVAAMLKHDADYMSKFMQILDEGLSDVEPEKTQDSNIRTLLTGRPIAIVRVSLKVDLKGLPVVNQSWNSLVDDILNPENKSSRECANFTKIKFPIRLGSPKERNEYNDGLLGYYREAKGKKDYNYNAFYSYQSDGSNEHIVNPADSIIELTADKATPSITLLVLMDPRGKLNVTSGILPKKSIEVPASHYEEFYNSMEVSFLTSPVLHHMEVWSEEGEAGIDIPLSGEGDHDWIWIGKDAKGWQEKKVLSRKTKTISQSPLMISEGWLRLVKRE